MAWIVCGVCNKRKKNAAVSFGGFGICGECIDTLPYSDGNGCFPAKAPIDYVISPFYYEGIIKTIVHRYKFQDETAYADIFACFMADKIREISHINKFDFVCSVPLSKRRMAERGYNQSELIAEKLCALTGMEYRDVLVRVRETQRQTDLELADRVQNVKDAFECREDLIGRRVLLVDDVYTHGLTAGEAAKALMQSGCESVVCAAAAIVQRTYL